MNAAARFYAAHLATSQAAAAYLYTHGIDHAADPAHGWQLGYAPHHWTALVDHLRAAGHTDGDITTAGLAFRHHTTGHLLDRFRSRLMFPITDPHNRTVAFTARDLTGRAEAKWINSPDTPLYRKSQTLYGLGQQLHQPPPGLGTPTVFVVEGAADVLAIHRMAHTRLNTDADRVYAVAPCGTHLTADQLHLLRKAIPDAHLVLAFDGDLAGGKALSRTYPIAKTWTGTVSAARLPTGYDPCDLLTELEPHHAASELIGRLEPLAQAEMTNRISQLYDNGRITKPDKYATDRLLVYQTIADLFIDDPQATTAMAQAAAAQLGIKATDVARGVIEATGDLTITTTGPDPPPTPGSGRRTGTAVAKRDTEPAATFAWARAQPTNRRIAIHARHDPARDITAWVIADPIGTCPEAAHAASTAARNAMDAALTHGPARGLQAARDTLNATYDNVPAQHTGDASIIAIVAHPNPASPQRIRFHIAWAGDIRAHTLHNGQLAQVTLDHTVARRNHDAGTPTPDGHIAHHLLTSSVRSGDISVCTLEHGTLLVCTNTVHNQLPLGQLATELAGMTDPRTTADRLAEALRLRVDRDGLVLAIHPTGAPPALLSTTARAAARTAAASFPTRPDAPANTSDQPKGTVRDRSPQPRPQADVHDWVHAGIRHQHQRLWVNSPLYQGPRHM